LKPYQNFLKRDLVNNNLENNFSPELIIKGIAGAPGIAEGELFILRRDRIPVKREIIPTEEIDNEIKRFREAISESVAEIKRIKRNITERIDDEAVGIIDAQIMAVNDEEIIRSVEAEIRKERLNAEYVYDKLVREVIDSLENSDNDYFRQRVYDIKGVRSRVLSNLMGIKQKSIFEITKPSIVASRLLSAGEVAQIAGGNVLGLITAVGGATSHIALLAKSLNIPTVLGIDDKYHLLKNGADIILDGNEGKIILHPTEETRKEYSNRRLKLSKEKERLAINIEEPALTTDGHRINLLANIELSSEVKKAMDEGAEGVGLYRSEFLYFTFGGMPSEEQQFKVYSNIVKSAAPKPVTIRTFDLGGDKFADETNKPYEQNPFLGWRAIRISLALPNYFKAQLKAILRSSVFGNVSIMIPMVSDICEVKQALDIFEEVKEELSRERIPFDEDTKFGVMIEVPSAALNADPIAEIVDFFSIGTNDLTQYTLAVDRGNEVVNYLFKSLHPAVLRLADIAIKSAKRHSIPVSVCGELAGDPLATALLVGMGADSLSAPCSSLPFIKNIIRNINYEDAFKLADKVLSLSTTAEIKNFLADYLSGILEGLSYPLKR